MCAADLITSVKHSYVTPKNISQASVHFMPNDDIDTQTYEELVYLGRWWIPNQSFIPSLSTVMMGVISQPYQTQRFKVRLPSSPLFDKTFNIGLKNTDQAV